MKSYDEVLKWIEFLKTKNLSPYEHQMVNNARTTIEKFNQLHDGDQEGYIYRLYRNFGGDE